VQVAAVPAGQFLKAQNSIGLALQQTAGAGEQHLKSLNGPHFLHFSLGAQLPLVVVA